MSLVRMNFESKYLGNNHEIGILLPDRPFQKDPREFYESGKKYKVLWLLHGTFGDYSDWIRKSMIELYASERDLIVVMPSALNSIYENWPTFAMGFNMWDYFFEELMPMIYNWFPASDKKEDNYIAGLSMGGRGTMKYVCAHPEKFAAAAILSSCPKNLKEQMNNIPDIPSFKDRIQNSINNVGGLEKYYASPENTWEHCKELVNNPDPPRLFFCCGEDDMLYADYLSFKKYAEEIGLKATFQSEPGYRHEWRFWDLYIQKAIDFFEIPFSNDTTLLVKKDGNK